jgi:RNA polymerase sigma-70 factor (ECF subfamily)
MTTTLRASLPRDRDRATQRRELELSRLVDQHADFIWRVLKRLGTPAAELEDALQEVLLVVARKLPEYEERGGMRAWLFTIARQVASHAVRSAQRRERREWAHEDPRLVEDPLHALERSEASRFVTQFLEGLGEPQATVFFLAEIEGLTAPEISASMGVGLNTVYSRLRLARERFEHALEDRKDGSP